jgi:uncharacterized RDD family membrane protein YckC
VPPPPINTYGQASQQQAYGDAAAAPQASRWETPYVDRDPSAPFVRRYAGFWIRFGAYLLDQIFAFIVGLVPGILLAIVFVIIVEAGQEQALTPFEAQRQDDQTTNAAIAGFYLGFFPAFFGYLYIGTSMGGAWGKRICGLRIVKRDSGARPGFGSAAIRILVTVGMGFIPFFGSLIDHLSMLWDDNNQTFHDKAAGTVVIAT